MGLTSSASNLHSTAIRTDSSLVVPVVAVSGEESSEDRGSTLSLAGSEFEQSSGGNRGKDYLKLFFFLHFEFWTWHTVHFLDTVNFTHSHILSRFPRIVLYYFIGNQYYSTTYALSIVTFSVDGNQRISYGSNERMDWATSDGASVVCGGPFNKSWPSKVKRVGIAFWDNQ